eukprot:3332834-Amphidinium_carterae.1
MNELLATLAACHTTSPQPLQPKHGLACSICYHAIATSGINKKVALFHDPCDLQSRQQPPATEARKR